MVEPKRGEIWKVNFDPARGDEIQKQRPAIVISSDSMGVLGVKIVAPITGWSPSLMGKVWHVKIEPSRANGLSKVSSIDTLQIKSVSLERFASKMGVVEADLLEQVVAGIGIVIEYE